MTAHAPQPASSLPVEQVPDSGLATLTAGENGPLRLSALPDPCTSAELATVLGKSPKTIVDWCQERAYTHIPCFRLGNRWYHRPAELMRWLNGIKSGHVEFRRKPRNSAERK